MLYSTDDNLQQPKIYWFIGILFFSRLTCRCFLYPYLVSGAPSFPSNSSCVTLVQYLAKDFNGISKSLDTLLTDLCSNFTILAACSIISGGVFALSVFLL